MTLTIARDAGLAEFRDHAIRLLEPLRDDELPGSTEESDDRIAAVEEVGEGHAAEVARVRRFQASLYDVGLAWPSGPPELGGLGLTEAHDRALEELLYELGFPLRDSLFVGLHIVAPAIAEHADPELRDRVLQPLLRGELLGCQLFSEPDAGSDLAGVTTKAVRDGEDWLITGQKVWTSMAHLAHVGEVLVRTDREASKHAGLTMFLLDMAAPGVTVRPIRQMTGGSAFNEVFLDGVRVPDTDRIGAVGEGWRVATSSLGSERSSMSGPTGPVSGDVVRRFHELVSRHDVEDGSAHHEAIARAVTSILALRAASKLSDASWTHTLAPVAGSVQKMLMVRAMDDIAAAASDMLGVRAYSDDGTVDAYAWSEFVLGVPGLHLAGGTDEIQRTVIAQRGLGLPREPRTKA